MGESVKDETAQYFSQLSEDLTGLVKDIFRYIFKQKMDKVEKSIHNFIMLIGPSGIMRMMGFRKTIGS